MYVCVCKAVTSSEVQAAIDRGASSVGEVTRACRAGGDCGTCHARIDQMIEGRCDGSSPFADVLITRGLARSRAA
jgi:bacterioferritin-associated ferredoxin